MRNRILAAAALSVMFSAAANAALVIEQQQNASPASGLASWTLVARGTAGEIIAGIAGIDVANCHNVWPAFNSTGTQHSGIWAAGGGGAGQSGWSIYDTHFLLSPTDASKVTGLIGSMTETNDGTDPAGLGLNFSGQAATEGIGNWKFAAETDQIGLTAAAGGSTVAFLQVVLEDTAMAPFSLALFDAQGNRQDVSGVIGIPEPATLAMAGLGMIGMISVSRRRKA